ncbi:MAG: division/cell wall cluster transcriptional repressor MraZ [bacterium]|nr:division/cell wall cluster transcriptional repressor MraZ [bacterium]
MFLSCFDHVLDEKGRTSLPKSFRKQLSGFSDEPVLTAHSDCLAIYPPDEFERLREHYSQPGLNDARQRLKRLTMGLATLLSVDRQGRILIPARLRELAGLQREIVFLGVDQTIEIWDLARFQRDIRQTQSEFPTLTRDSGEVPR